ncbi:MAG: TonB-dependent receptor plug domain-containing protein, partial [Bryobacteraceae bacterium]
MDIGALLNLDVTTASRFADKLSNAPGIMSVVTSDEVRRFGGITLGETLQRVPGLTGSTQYLADRSQVAALGDQTKASGGHILFPINGRPTREVLEGGIISGLLESFPVAVLKRIEIVKGPGSVLYGSNAFSAAINLITLKATHNQATALAMSGPGGGMSSAATGTYQRGDLSVVAAGQNHDAPDWRPTYSVPLSERNDPTVPAVSNVQYPTLVERGSGGYLGLNYKDLSFMSAFTEWQSNGVTEGTVSETRLTRVFGNPGYDHKVAQNRDMNYNLAFTRTTFTANDFLFVKRDSNEFIAGWTSFITLTPRDRLTAGAPFSRIAGVEDFTAASPPLVVADGSRSGGAFYARIDHRLGDEVKLIGGFQT